MIEREPTWLSHIVGCAKLIGVGQLETTSSE